MYLVVFENDESLLANIDIKYKITDNQIEAYLKDKNSFSTLKRNSYIYTW